MPDGAGYAVLDGHGGLFRYGTAVNLPSVAPSHNWSFDIARDVVLTASGYYVLSGYGDLVTSGPVQKFAGFGYAQYDRWRGIAVIGNHLRVVRNDGVDVKAVNAP